MINFKIIESTKLDGSKRYRVYACDGIRRWWHLWLLKWENIDYDSCARHMGIDTVPATHYTLDDAIKSMKEYCRRVRGSKTVRTDTVTISVAIDTDEFETKLDTLKEYSK